MFDIVLHIKGKKFDGWTGANVMKSLYQMSGSFSLGATDTFPGDTKKWDIKMGDECSVSINDQTIITGYIEDIPISYDATSHSIEFSGRDKTGDLVDCSFSETSKEWKDQKVITIIEALCKPFNITVKLDNSVADQAATGSVMGLKRKVSTKKQTPKGTFKINEGETVFDTIFRLCKPKGILPVSYGDGKLVLTATGTQKVTDALVFGKNILSGSITQSDKERFAEYIIKGQGEKSIFGTVTEASSPKAIYKDNIIVKTRPWRKIVIWPESSCTVGYCQDLAKWEGMNRAGKSRSVDYEVQGWTQSDGKVWPLNALVKVKDSFLGINKEMLIASVNFIISNEGGTITRLNLVHPDTFNMPPYNPTEDMATGFDFFKIIQTGN
jgi:prophage tail gpP-like protein